MRKRSRRQAALALTQTLLCWYATTPEYATAANLEELRLVVNVDRLVDDLGQPELVDVQSRDVSVVEDERVAELMV